MLRPIGALVFLTAGVSAQALRVGTFPQQVRAFYSTADGLPSKDVQDVFVDRGEVYAVTAAGAAEFAGGKWNPVSAVPSHAVVKEAAATDGSTWTATSNGAWHRSVNAVEYRAGPRWLPDDDVRAVATLGTAAWFATANGVGVIRERPVTLAEKAEFFEAEIDKRHRRTPYGYVLAVRVETPGDSSKWRQTDSDNDGLWTAMYGAGECFSCAATESPKACDRARKAFEALRFLGMVTQSGSHPAPKGFVARTILPMSGRDPNLSDSPERDQRIRSTSDPLWKIMQPRWPAGAGGNWYWKSDTSSDELDGHFFFYGLYYDLVATAGADRRAVREHVASIADHLIEHNFQYLDHDGKPARWGIFNPENLNRNTDWWVERGLNSISILSYLKTAEHITGDSKYADAARLLIEKHSYDLNTLIPKSHGGPGSGNQSDDEMAFMCLYNLMKYEKDARLRMIYGLALRHRWEVEAPELNPLFNFIAAAGLATEKLSLTGPWLEESAETLRRFPLDLFNWPLKNSHRPDIVRLRSFIAGRGGARGHRVDGRVLPVDERFVEHWNHDPWRLDYPGDGRLLADGASFLLPYYMGLYHKFIAN
jgi:hypothetical protein